jgi:hypothetical protein
MDPARSHRRGELRYSLEALAPAGRGQDVRARPTRPYPALALLETRRFALGLALAVSAAAQAQAGAGLQERFSAMTGLAQWTLFRGGNVAFEYRRGRLAFEVSHGQGLDLNQAGGFALTGEERDAGARVRVPWTTGFGVGVRLTENLHVLLELKAHRYNVSGRDRNAEVTYTTYSIGPGVFYTFYLYKGLFLQPNLRFWPNVASSLPDGGAALVQPGGTTYLHKAHSFGLFANMNLGWSF